MFSRLNISLDFIINFIFSYKPNTIKILWNNFTSELTIAYDLHSLNGNGDSNIFYKITFAVVIIYIHKMCLKTITLECLFVAIIKKMY